MSKQACVVVFEYLCLCALKTKQRRQQCFQRALIFFLFSSLPQRPLTFQRYCTAQSLYTGWWKPGCPCDLWTSCAACLSSDCSIMRYCSTLISQSLLYSIYSWFDFHLISSSFRLSVYRLHCFTGHSFPFCSVLFYSEALPFFHFALLQPGLPCFAPSRSVPCSLPFIQRSPELGSAAGSEGEDTKAPKTVQKSQSVNLWRKHTPSSHSKDLNTHTHFRCRFGSVLENKALILVCLKASGQKFLLRLIYV